MKKTGSSLSKMVFLRLICAVTAGWVLHIILPSELGKPVHGVPEAVGGLAEVHTIGLDLSGLPFMLRDWFIDSMVQIVSIQLIIFCIMFIQKLLDEFGIMKLLGRIMAPLMGIFGLPRETGYLWIVANLVGLAYGSAILIEEVRSGAISKTDADLFNHYASISHSHLEDNLLFVAVGVPLFWAAIPRLLMAILVVWLERFRRFLVLRSYRVRVE
jgi:spore maturation protein SpmB